MAGASVDTPGSSAGVAGASVGARASGSPGMPGVSGASGVPVVSRAARPKRVPRANAPMRRAFSSADRALTSSAGTAAGCSAGAACCGPRRRRFGRPPAVVVSTGSATRSVGRSGAPGPAGRPAAGEGPASESSACGASGTAATWVSSADGRNTTARTPPYGDRVSTETLNPYRAASTPMTANPNCGGSSSRVTSTASRPVSSAAACSVARPSMPTPASSMTTHAPLCTDWTVTSTVVLGWEWRAALSRSSATARTTGSTARLSTAMSACPFTRTRR